MPRRGQQGATQRARVHPLALATLVLALVLVVQALVFDRRLAQDAARGYRPGDFLDLLANERSPALARRRAGVRRTGRVRRGGSAGSCVFAGLQLFGLDAMVPGVIPRAGDRLSGNVDQANQFASLLWLGAIAVVWLAATEVLPWTLATAMVVVLEGCVVTSGSRAVWVYVAFALALGSAAWLTRGSDARAAGVSPSGSSPSALSQGAVSLLVVSTHMLAPFQITAAEQRIGNESARRVHEPALVVLALGARHRGRASSARRRHRPAARFGARACGRCGRCPGSRRRRARAQPHRSGRCGDGASRRRSFCSAPSSSWVVLAWRHRPVSASNIAGLAMAGVMLIHANLEHPFAYLYVLALFGAVVGQVRVA